MPSKILKTIKGRRIRITRENSAGAYIVGTCSSVVSDGFITVTLANELQKGQEFTQQNAWGDFCISEKDGDRVKWTNVTIQLCEVNPDLLDIIGGESITPVNATIATILTTIGFTQGQQVNTQAFGFEMWTRQVRSTASEWGYFACPMVINGSIDGSVAVSNGALTLTVRGEAVAAPASWGTSPYLDNPLMATGGFPAGEVWGGVVTTVQPPALTAGCASLA